MILLATVFESEFPDSQGGKWLCEAIFRWLFTKDAAIQKARGAF